MNLRGCGGSGGGVVIIGSSANIQNSGIISARGGNGGPHSMAFSQGGGGGGGVGHLLAPMINSVGGDVSGGKVRRHNPPAPFLMPFVLPEQGEVARAVMEAVELF